MNNNRFMTMELFQRGMFGQQTILQEMIISDLRLNRNTHRHLLSIKDIFVSCTNTVLNSIS